MDGAFNNFHPSTNLMQPLITNYTQLSVILAKGSSSALAPRRRSTLSQAEAM
jgi:hypothetical protein